MEKIFPGYQVIRLEQATSTNWELLQLSNEKHLPEGTVVITNSQTHGRGQGENSWESEPGRNLTFSIILYPLSVEASGQFVLSKVISLAVCDFVSQIVPGVSVKWPNDVYVGERKITGILIENFIGGAYIMKSIVGIGVNINQERFVSNAPNPVSLRQLTDKNYRLEECFETLHNSIANRYKMIRGHQEDKLHEDYLRHMYRLGQLNRFWADGEYFDAVITGVNKYGMLEMITTENKRRTFGFKEVVFE